METFAPVTRFWRQAWRAATARVRPAAARLDEVLVFTCNVCGQTARAALGTLQREPRSCEHCASSVRQRSLIHVLSLELFGQSIPLPEFPTRPDIIGLGLSDWFVLAETLATKLGYRNTFYHKEPRLDITDIDPALEGKLDFLTSSDVFEHVEPPISRAFEGARRLLKPDGVLVLTVPYRLDGDTVEHFPGLHKYEIIDRDGKSVLHNVRADGTHEVYESLVFHGGVGATLEMRLFSKQSLLADLAAAGFSRVRIHDEPCLRYGIVWLAPWSLPILARP